MPNESPWRYWLEETPSTLFPAKIPGGDTVVYGLLAKTTEQGNGRISGGAGKASPFRSAAEFKV